MKTPIICRDPEVMGGTPVFYGTRVPVQTLFDYLEAGDSIDEFLAGFPSVTREQVIVFLEAAKDRLLETVASGFSSMNALTGGFRMNSSATKCSPLIRWDGLRSRTASY